MTDKTYELGNGYTFHAGERARTALTGLGIESPERQAEVLDRVAELARTALAAPASGTTAPLDSQETTATAGTTIEAIPDE